MAFFRKAGNMLRHTVGKHINSELCGSKPSILQAIRSMSSSKVFVGGLSFQTDDRGLTEAFSQYGEIVEARVIVDRESGKSRGFGFVTYASSEEAASAIQALDGQELNGRNVSVSFANDRPPRPMGGGGGGFDGGRGGYGGGGNGYGGGGGYGGNNSYGSRGGGGGGGYGDNSFASRGGAGGNDGGFGGGPEPGLGGISFGNSKSSSFGAPDGGFGQNDDGNFGDVADEEPSNYANKA